MWLPGLLNHKYGRVKIAIDYFMYGEVAQLGERQENKDKV